MKSFGVLLKKEITEQWRTRQLPAAAVIFLLLGLGSPVIAKYTPDIVKMAAGSINIPVPTPTSKDAVAQLVKNLNQFGVLTAVLLAMGSVAREKESGTAAFVLSKPVSRGAFLGAKFGGIVLTMASAALTCGVAAYLYTDLLFAPLSGIGFAAACLVILLGLLEIAAVTFFGSALMGSATPAAGLGLVTVIATGVVSSIPQVARFTPFGLNRLASDLALDQVGTGWGWPLIANGGLVLVALAASWFVFRRQEL